MCLHFKFKLEFERPLDIKSCKGLLYNYEQRKLLPKMFKCSPKNKICSHYLSLIWPIFNNDQITFKELNNLELCRKVSNNGNLYITALVFEIYK